MPHRPWQPSNRSSNGETAGGGLSGLSSHMRPPGNEGAENLDEQISAMEARLFMNMLARYDKLESRVSALEGGAAMTGVSFAIGRRSTVRHSIPSRPPAAGGGSGIELAAFSSTNSATLSEAGDHPQPHDHGHGHAHSHGEHGGSEDQPMSMPRSLSWNEESCAFNSFHLVKASTDSIQSIQKIGELDEKIQERELQSSIWELIILMGIPGVGLWSSVLIGVCLVLNIFCQCIFLIVLHAQMVDEDSFSSVAHFKHWRYTVAHNEDQIEKSTWRSMATRVCGGDESLSSSVFQSAIYDNINDYMEQPRSTFGKPIGACLVMVSIFIFGLTIINELWEALHFCQGLTMLPKGTKTLVLRRGDEEGDAQPLALVSVSWIRYVCLMSVTVLRFCIAATLLYLGSNWLAKTYELGEIVLNALAMIFIIDVDELLFDIGISLPTKEIYRALKPLVRHNKLRDTRYPGPLNLIGLMLFIAWVCWVTIAPLMFDMRLAQSELCEGNTLFAVGLHGPTGMVISTITNTEQTEFERARWDVAYEYLWNSSVDELTSWNATTANRSSFSMEIQDRYVFQTMLTESAEDWVQRRPCEDAVADAVESQVLWHTLRQFWNSSARDGCADHVANCTSEHALLLRSSCPVTCGCQSPRSGLVWTHPSQGCHRSACERHENYGSLLKDVGDCVDPSPAELLLMPGWQTLMVQLPQLVHRMNVTGMVDAFTGRGCGAIVRGGPNNSGDYFRELCQTNSEATITSLHAFCPKACGCSALVEAEAPRCPRSCFVSDPMTGLEGFTLVKSEAGNEALGSALSLARGVP